MGRAMLIMCAASLIVIGYINMSTSKQGRMLTQKNVNYADFIMAKNTAQTAIQMAMQKINGDENWANNHDKSQGSPPWTPTIEGRKVSLYTNYKEHPQFFEADTLRLVANAEYKNLTVEVNSLYWMEPFSTLVPEFQGALQLPTDIGTFGVDGTAHNINGTPPSDSGCTDGKPPVTVSSDETRQKVESVGANVDGDIVVDPSLNYEPTDELIERLYNSGNAINVGGNYSSQLGTAENPGVFFVEGSVKLTGQQSEGYGILVVRSGGSMEYGEDGDLSVAGNFEFNGLVIFENAFNFDGRGTPTINGSVLIGNTSDYSGDPINISLGGNININYDCRGEEFAKKSAALAVKQNRYSRVTTTEGVNFSQ